MIALAVLALAPLPAVAQHTVTPPSALRLPLGTVFKGDSKFRALVRQAERENWRQLPLGARTIRVARAMLGTPYVNYTLEVHDRIESPVVNLSGMDCWTYYENALAFARMLRYKPGRVNERGNGRLSCRDRPLPEFRGRRIVRPDHHDPGMF